MTIYFDTEKQAFAQKETIENWGKVYLTECTDEQFEDFQKGKLIFDENDNLVENPKYAEEKELEEKKRVAMLKMTPRDFLLAITQMGVDFAKIKELMASNPQVEIELNYCNYVYRGNALLDQLCGQFGITTTQLDELFKSKGS